MSGQHRTLEERGGRHSQRYALGWDGMSKWTKVPWMVTKAEMGTAFAQESRPSRGPAQSGEARERGEVRGTGVNGRLRGAWDGWLSSRESLETRACQCVLRCVHASPPVFWRVKGKAPGKGSRDLRISEAGPRPHQPRSESKCVLRGMSKQETGTQGKGQRTSK
jgi:hypothetical protein